MACPIMTAAPRGWSSSRHPGDTGSLRLGQETLPERWVRNCSLEPRWGVLESLKTSRHWRCFWHPKTRTGSPANPLALRVVFAGWATDATGAHHRVPVEACL